MFFNNWENVEDSRALESKSVSESDLVTSSDSVAIVSKSLKGDFSFILGSSSSKSDNDGGGGGVRQNGCEGS